MTIAFAFFFSLSLSLPRLRSPDLGALVQLSQRPHASCLPAALPGGGQGEDERGVIRVDIEGVSGERGGGRRRLVVVMMMMMKS